MAKGFVTAEEGHVVLVEPPPGTTLAAALSGACFNMENWGHVTIIAMGGAGSSANALTINECTGPSGTGATAMTFRYAKESSTGGDTLDAALAWASTASLGATANVFIVAEIDADELTDGYQYIRPDIAAGSGKALACVAILSGGRYQEDITATVIA